jgi:putative peptide zinc metalloprotease protein
MTGALTGASRVSLHELAMRAERRDGEPEWVVGRADTGEFAALPQIAVDVIAELRDGWTIAQAHERILRDHRRDIDVAEFVTSLVALGFVRAVDGVPVPGAEPVRSTLPRLRPGHVRWLFTVPAMLTAAVLVAAGAVVVVLRPHLLPVWSDLFWSEHTSAVLVGNAVLGWCVIGVHELAHLLAARAAGVGGRISLGSRLQWLVAQTDVSGIWGVSRPQRMITYLAGTGVNLLIAAAAILTRAACGPDTAAGRLAGAIAVLSLLPLPYELLLFARTDGYFVLQDLTGCRNLYADGSAYVGHIATAGWRAVTRSVAPRANPMHALPRRERLAVRLYTVVLATGTTACIAVAVAVTVPFTVAVIVSAVTGLTGGRGTAGTADAVVTAALITIYWILWGRVWWRRHGTRVAGLLRRAPHTTRRQRKGGEPAWRRS